MFRVIVLSLILKFSLENFLSELQLKRIKKSVLCMTYNLLSAWIGIQCLQFGIPVPDHVLRI